MLLGISLGSETKRKLLHISAGALFLSMLLIFGRMKLTVLLVAILLGGILIINLLLMKWRFGITDWYLHNFERPRIRFPGYSTAWYVAGLLMAVTMLQSESEIAAVICSLAFGDGLSSLIGERGKRKLFYNPDKTLEGFAAFFLGTLPSVFFVGWIGIPFALASAVFESIPLKIDDNFIVPLFGALFFHIF